MSKQHAKVRGDGSREQRNGLPRQTLDSPDFDAYSDLLERESRAVASLLTALACFSTTNLALIATLVGLSYVGGKLVDAGKGLDLLAIIGVLGIAVMVAGVGVTGLLVGRRQDAKNEEEVPGDRAPELDNEQEGSPETREAKRPNRC
jgi:hypothetical protein